jgi:hypothetical protein
MQNRRADPRKVVSIILGGGAGTRLFPLTKRRAKPAVRIRILLLYFEAPLSLPNLCCVCLSQLIIFGANEFPESFPILSEMHVDACYDH